MLHVLNRSLNKHNISKFNSQRFTYFNFDKINKFLYRVGKELINLFV